jgi:Mg/Co/Ni transporter MgtE
MDKELLELLQAQDYQAAATLVEKYKPEDLADVLKQQETTSKEFITEMMSKSFSLTLLEFINLSKS